MGCSCSIEVFTEVLVASAFRAEVRGSPPIGMLVPPTPIFPLARGLNPGVFAISTLTLLFH